MWTRKIPNTDTFYAVNNIPIPESPFSKTIVVSTHLNKIKNKQKKKKKRNKENEKASQEEIEHTNLLLYLER